MNVMKNTKLGMMLDGTWDCAIMLKNIKLGMMLDGTWDAQRSAHHPRVRSVSDEMCFLFFVFSDAHVNRQRVTCQLGVTSQ